MNKTIVANIRDTSDGVYIGREGKGRDGYFGNPFRLEHSNNDRDLVIEKFKHYFYERIIFDQKFYNRVLELRGKTLLCFCSPLRCHGDIIAEWLNKQKEIIE